MGVPVYQWQPTTDEIAGRAGIPPERVVRFDQNTSPFAPPWAIPEAKRAVATVNEYPRADYRPLRRAIADYHGIDDETRVVVGAGADEIILLVAKSYLGPEKTAVAEAPTYALYRIATLQVDAQFTAAPRIRAGLRFAAGTMAEAAAGADVTWLCVPHNPAGDRPSDREIAEVIDAAGGITFIDAAYAEFAPGGWRGLISDREDVITAGTLSKAFGLAGIRVGYAITSPGHAARLDAMRPPGSVSNVSAALALRAFEEPAWMEENVAFITAGRDELSGRIARLGLRVHPTTTNFVLAEVGTRARDIASTLMDRAGLVVRSFPAGHPFETFLRFTVRIPDDHNRLITALENAL